MTYNLEFYVTTSDNRVINKSLTSLGSRNVKLLDGASVQAPTFRIKYDASLIPANFAYFPHFNRYYYIEPVSVSPGRQMVFKCTCDVLMTYKPYILNLQPVVARAQNKRNSLLQDTSVVNQANRQLEIKQFSADPFGIVNYNTQRIYMLTVLGGAKNGTD